jgi:hypothetical protein
MSADEHATPDDDFDWPAFLKVLPPAPPPEPSGYFAACYRDGPVWNVFALALTEAAAQAALTRGVAEGVRTAVKPWVPPPSDGWARPAVELLVDDEGRFTGRPATNLEVVVDPRVPPEEGWRRIGPHKLAMNPVAHLHYCAEADDAGLLAALGSVPPRGLPPEPSAN